MLPVKSHFSIPKTAGEVELKSPISDRATHAPDFSAVNWFGTVYTFSPRQRQVIADLWQAWEDGYLFISQDALLHHAESECSRLRDLFVNSPAWGAMIVKGVDRGGRAGQYCLAIPTKPSPSPEAICSPDT